MTSQTTMGTTIGRHRIARLLGGGTLGRVFACKSPEREQLVAIKMLRTKYAALGDSVLKQRNALEKIESPHVVTIHDVAVFNNVAYLVMELVEGESLQERLTKGTLRTVDALALARAIVLGLQAGWAHGIAHGDLRPANVLLPGGDIKAAKLVDFQLAVPVEGTESVRGSPSYLAPELLVGTPCDALSDLYALGCLLHEALTGKPPFTGPPSSVLNAQANTTPPTFAATLPGAPQGLVDLVDRLLEKDRSKRIKTHGEALAGIERALAGQGMAAPRGPDIPSYEVDVDVEFDSERTDEFHLSPAREQLERAMTPVANPGVGSPGSPGRTPLDVPAALALDSAPTQVRPVVPLAPLAAPPRPMFVSAPLEAKEASRPMRASPPSSVPVVPVSSGDREASRPMRASPPSSVPVVPMSSGDGVGFYRSPPRARPAPAPEPVDEEIPIDDDDEHTRVQAGIAQAIPSAEDLGLILTPVVPKK